MHSYEPTPFRPINRRRRFLIALLAIATAAFVVWAMTRKSGLVRNAALHPADVAACTKGQTAGCVGSMTSIIAMPAAAGPAGSASAAGSAGSAILPAVPASARALPRP